MDTLTLGKVFILSVVIGIGCSEVQAQEAPSWLLPEHSLIRGVIAAEQFPLDGSDAMVIPIRGAVNLIPGSGLPSDKMRYSSGIGGGIGMVDVKPGDQFIAVVWNHDGVSEIISSSGSDVPFPQTIMRLEAAEIDLLQRYIFFDNSNEAETRWAFGMGMLAKEYHQVLFRYMGAEVVDASRQGIDANNQAGASFAQMLGVQQVPMEDYAWLDSQMCPNLIGYYLSPERVGRLMGCMHEGQADWAIQRLRTIHTALTARIAEENNSLRLIDEVMNGKAEIEK